MEKVIPEDGSDNWYRPRFILKINKNLTSMAEVRHSRAKISGRDDHKLRWQLLTLSRPGRLLLTLLLELMKPRSGIKLAQFLYEHPLMFRSGFLLVLNTLGALPSSLPQADRGAHHHLRFCG
jgi:hypothetical protein